MKPRARLTRLVLINWRGIFYQPFDMADGITALEGANGAGKTTVMVALFVALLPDRRLLSFRNVGESGGEGDRGIYGRLGANPPAYSLIEFDTGDGRRLWGGVQLTRRSEPNLELNPFLIEGLDPEIEPHEVLLHTMDDQEAVPTLPELKQQIALHGGMLKPLDSVTAYLGALYDQGLLPQPLTNYDERSRFHKVLETSMMGGLSGFIQKGLRDYLLAEDGKLGNHVRHMRENLEACRITRRQIAEANQRYDMIHGVYEAGWGLLAAAFHGTRLRARQARKGLTSEIGELRGRRNRVARTEKELAAAHAKHEAQKATLHQSRDHANQAEASAHRAEQAFQLATQVGQLQTEEAARRTTRDQADALCQDRQRDYDQAYQHHELEQSNRNRLAAALADAQTAFEQLHRRVAELKAARQSLADARETLPDRDITRDNATELQTLCEQQWREALDAKATAERALESLQARQARFDAAHQALQRIAGAPIPPQRAGAEARHWDGRLREIEGEIRAGSELSGQIETARNKAEAQTALRAQADTLGIAGRDPLVLALRTLRTEESELRQKETASEQTRSEAQATLIRCDERLPPLQQRLAAWQESQQLAADLLEQASQGFSEPAQIAELADRLQGALRANEEAQARHREEARQRDDEANRLEFGGGRLPESLITLADRLDGQLLAEQFDDLPEEQAARVEAQLGPLAGAILVEDPLQAAQDAAEDSERPDTLWLVQAAGLDRLPSSNTIGNAEIVHGEGFLRLTRHPDHPVIGRTAREREIARLREAAQAARDQADLLTQTLIALQHAHRQAVRLIPMAGQLFEPSPAQRIDELEQQQRQAKRTVREQEQAIQSIRARLHVIRQRSDALNDLLPQADLLDPPDWPEALDRLHAQKHDIDKQRRWIEAHAADREAMNQGFVELQSPPDESEGDRLSSRLADAEKALTYWQRGRELLRILCERLPWFDHEADETLLAKKDGQLAELRGRQQSAEDGVRQAKAALDLAATALEQAQQGFRKVDSSWRTIQSELEQRQGELLETGLAGTAEERDRLRADANEARKALDLAQQAEREADKAVDRAGQRLKTEKKEAQEYLAQVKTTLRETRPNWRHWVRLKGEIRAADLHQRLLDSDDATDSGEGNHIAFFNTAHEKAGALRSILSQAEGGKGLLERIEPSLNSREEAARGLANLRVWLTIRSWLEQRIPRDIAQAEEPEIALNQIRDHLALLSSRLSDQEQTLRQRTEDVANSIAGRIRRETQRITQFNRQLAEIRFGSIHGIRLQLERIPTFEALLTKLRAEPDLFAADMPLEDAMVQVFEQVGGGRVRGEQLLDYREYLKLSVRVRRMGTDQWAEARAGSLSTGESIGVGAAILIVILDAWEHQAAILRGARANGSLRFLFLDEATRLDANALDTLTDFCERMKVQLLAAAPGLDRARRGHVYTLMRLDQEGNEQVLVRGRRWS